MGALVRRIAGFGFNLALGWFFCYSGALCCMDFASKLQGILETKREAVRAIHARLFRRVLSFLSCVVGTPYTRFCGIGAPHHPFPMAALHPAGGSVGGTRPNALVVFPCLVFLYHSYTIYRGF